MQPEIYPLNYVTIISIAIYYIIRPINHNKEDAYIQVPDNRVVRVDLKHPSASHEFHAGGITHRLCLH